jgi:hypothetical protein
LPSASSTTPSNLPSNKTLNPSEGAAPSSVQPLFHCAKRKKPQQIAAKIRNLLRIFAQIRIFAEKF